MLDPRFCVEISVPSSSGEPDEGSGFTLATDEPDFGWVLTAYHVLFGEQAEQAADVQLTLVWSKAPQGDDGTRPQATADRTAIVWAHKDLDLAVVRCRLPELGEPLLPANSLIARQVPENHNTAWESYGFLSNYGDRKGNRSHQQPSGTLGHYTRGDSDQSLTVTAGAMKSKNAWAGFSGSPVFVGGRLLAVVLDANPGRDGESLGVAFLPEALECSAGPDEKTLAELLGVDLDEDYPQTLRDWFAPLLLRTLGCGQGAPTGLCKNAVDVCVRLLPSVNVSVPTDMVDALLDSTPANRVAFVEQLETGLRDATDDNDERAVHQLALLILCLVFPGHQAVTSVRVQRRNGDSIIQADTADPLSTEAAQAAADLQVPRIHYHAGGVSFPYNVGYKSSRGGLDDTQAQAVADIASVLTQKSVPGDCHQLAQAIWLECYQGGAAGGTAAALPGGEDKLRAMARRAGKQPRRFYVQLPRDDGGNSGWTVLKRWFDKLDLLQMREHADPATTDLIGDLEDIIRRTQPKE